MTVYEVCIKDQEGQWEKVGVTHTRPAKAKEELLELNLRYPEAFVASVWYTPRADGSLWRRPMVRLTPLAWLQPTHKSGAENRLPEGTNK